MFSEKIEGWQAKEIRAQGEEGKCIVSDKYGSLERASNEKDRPH